MRAAILITFLVPLLPMLSAEEALRDSPEEKSGEHLPESSSSLLQKLAEFSKETRDNAEAEIRIKEAQVVEVLKAHLTDQTKAGNLQGAIAIQSEIDRLTLTADSNTDELKEETISTTAMEPDFDFFDEYWRAEGAGDLVWRFFEDGTGLKLFNELKHEITWSFQEDGTVLANTPIGEEVLSFGRRDKDCFLVLPNGTKKPLKKLD